GAHARLPSPAPDLTREDGPEAVLLEQPVQVGAQHACTLERDRALVLRAVGVVEVDPARSTGGAAVVDLVAADPLPHRRAPPLADDLVAVEHRLDIQQAEPLHLAAAPLDTVVNDTPPEQLVAAADA